MCVTINISCRVDSYSTLQFFSKRAEDLEVRLGEWDFKNPTEPMPHQDIRVSRIIRHPDYVTRDIINDVALLILERQAQLGHSVQTICLPRPFQTFDGSRCHSSGWGKNVFGEKGKYQQVSHRVEA